MAQRLGSLQALIVLQADETGIRYFSWKIKTTLLLEPIQVNRLVHLFRVPDRGHRTMIFVPLLHEIKYQAKHKNNSKYQA